MARVSTLFVSCLGLTLLAAAAGDALRRGEDALIQRRYKDAVVALGKALLDQLALGEKRPPPHAQIKVPLTLRPGESDQPMRLDKSAPVSKRIRKRAPAA